MSETKVSYRGRLEKGHAGERELARLLTEALGRSVERNVDQARAGGADLLLTDLYAIQVKRQQDLALATWWRQTVRDAARHELRPALAYRQNRQPWQVVIRLSDLVPAIEGDETAVLSLAGFVQVVQGMLT